METDKIIAVSIMFILALTGITFHLTLLVLKFRLKSMHHTFFMLLTSLAIGDAGALLIFLFWCIPVLLWEIPVGPYYPSAHIPGFVSVTLYHVGAFSAFVISLNRFTAIWFPTKYKIIFDDKMVKYMVVAIWLLSAAVCLPLLIPPCEFSYNYAMFIWMFGDNYCSYVFSEFSGNVLDISLFASILLINWGTFFKVFSQYSRTLLDSNFKQLI